MKNTEVITCQEPDSILYSNEHDLPIGQVFTLEHPESVSKKYSLLFRKSPAMLAIIDEAAELIEANMVTKEVSDNAWKEILDKMRNVLVCFEEIDNDAEFESKPLFYMGNIYEQIGEYEHYTTVKFSVNNTSDPKSFFDDIARTWYVDAPDDRLEDCYIFPNGNSVWCSGPQVVSEDTFNEAKMVIEFKEEFVTNRVKEQEDGK